MCLFCFDDPGHFYDDDPCVLSLLTFIVIIPFLIAGPVYFSNGYDKDVGGWRSSTLTPAFITKYSNCDYPKKQPYKFHVEYYQINEIKTCSPN